MINIVIYQPEIPQNTGNIMRTCAGTYAKLHLIKPLGFSLNEKAIKRSGVNYLEHCDYQVYEDWQDFIDKNSGTLYFYENYGNKRYSDADYSDHKGNIYLVFGKESTGISDEILREYPDKCLRIPTNNKIRALNLSNCVAIVLFEVLRQQGFPDLLKEDAFKEKDYLID